MNEHLGGFLSALIDGSLDAAERASAEAHLRICAQCAAEADALTLTLADLRALERPVLTEMDRARLRSDVQRARRVPRFAMRLGAAAAVLALAAGGSIFLTRGDDTTTAGTFAAAEIEDGDYTEAAAKALLTEADAAAATGSTEAERSAALPSAAEAPIANPLAVTSDQAGSGPPEDTAGAIPDIDHGARIAQCEGIFLGTDDVVRVRRIVSRYEGEPAYLLTYRVPKEESTHIELWVVSIEGCEIRLFAQEKLED